MRAVIVVVAFLLCLTAGCSSNSGPPPTASQDQVDVRVPTVKPSTSTITVSDAVPSLEELQALGLGELAAECFITTIDPDGTGRVASAELFLEAFGACS